jgi:hypothetical protein
VDLAEDLLGGVPGRVEGVSPDGNLLFDAG